MVTPGLPLLAKKYNVSIDMVSSLIIGFLAFWIGFTTFFTAAGANVWGKRPFFMVSTVILLATNVWGFFTRVGLNAKPQSVMYLTQNSHSYLLLSCE